MCINLVFIPEMFRLMNIVSFLDSTIVKRTYASCFGPCIIEECPTFQHSQKLTEYVHMSVVRVTIK
jgi:hypothetical protein